MTIAEQKPSEREHWAHPAELFPAHLAALDRRLGRALAASQFDGLVVFSGRETAPPRDDVAYPFRAEPYFKAWAPLTRHPGSILQITPRRRPVLIYVQNDDYWHQPPQDPDGFWVPHFEICKARSTKEALRLLGDTSRWAAIAAPAEAAGRFAATDDRTLLQRLDFDRAVKTPYEISCIREANEIAARGHLAARATLGSGNSEFELNALYCAATGQRESELPYPNIVALNEHASILHYQHLDRHSPARIGSLLLDAGAFFHGYAADVSRTWAEPQTEFESLVAALDTLQRSLCGQIREGVEFTDLNDQAHCALAATMAAHGLLRCTAEQAYTQGITRFFLPHGLGHLIGLQVHDVGGRQIDPDGTLRPAPPAHPHLRLTRRLQAGFVVTIEPGIYFIPSLLEALAASASAPHVDWDTIGRLTAFGGIRIEDNVVVTTDGARNLTRAALADGNGSGRTDSTSGTH